MSTQNVVCRICGSAAFQLPSGVYLRRVNEFGVPGIWECSQACQPIQAAAQAGGVVVPPLLDTDPEWQDVAFRADGHYNGEIGNAFRDGYALAVSRALPASRVLGEASDLEHDIEFLREISENMAAYRERNDWAAMDMAQQMVSDWRDELQEKLDALRAAKGGAT